jgi:serine/threonine protein kinase
MVKNESKGAGDLRKQRSKVTPSFPAGMATASQASRADTVTKRDSGPAELPPQFGRYRVIKKLGGGGMGTVYLVENTELEREEALKVPHFSDGDDPQVRERFLREAKSAAKLDHANLCPIYYAGVQDGIYYLTMRFLKGKPLSDYAGKPQPSRKVVDIVAKLALALEAAHAKGVIHRDLKPGNVMMVSGSGPVVMDFGLAKQIRQTEEKLTQDGWALGTPAYMPPEQLKGELDQIGPAADVYSLGVILYELLTGRLPFEGTTAMICGQILYTEPPLPSALVPGLSSALDGICRKAMAKAPAERYSSMKAFAAALLDYLRSGPATEGAYNLLSATADKAAVSQPVSVAWGGQPAEVSGLLQVAPEVMHSLPPAPREAQAPSVTLPSRPAPKTIQKASTTGDLGKRRTGGLVVGVAFGILAIIIGFWAVVVFRVSTAGGTLVVQVNEPDPELYVDGERVTVAWQNGGLKAEVGVKPGTRQVELKKDGFRAYGEEVLLEDRGRTLLVARLEPIQSTPNTRVAPALAGATQIVGAPTVDASPAAVAERPKSPAELTAIRNADIDRGKSVRASTDPTEIAEIVGEVAPGFTAKLPVIPGGVAIVAEHFGRTHVLSTHPLDPVRPCILTSTIEVPTEKKTSLTFDVSHSAAGDWQLIVLANGERLHDATVGPTTARGGWLSVSVDLTRFAGKQMVLELQNKATGYSHEWGFWDQVKITSRDAEESHETLPADAPPQSPTVTSVEGAVPGDVRDDNGLKMKFCWCPAGKTRGFWMGQYEVTQSEWVGVMGSMPSQAMNKGKGDRYPIYNVSLDQAIEFCRRMTSQERKAGRLPEGWSYRVPTEEDWEYACRAGTATATAFGDRLSSTQANFNGDWPHNGAPKGPNLQKAVEVGSYQPNAWGICDMHGNVKEFTTTPGRVRGGSWFDNGRNCCSEIFIPDPPNASESVGFRVARVPSLELKRMGRRP